MPEKSLKYIVLFVLAGVCVLGWMLRGRWQEKRERIFFPAMGTLWEVSVWTTEGPEFLSLGDQIIHEVYSYDIAFSDWSEQSELRMLEKGNMTEWMAASPLFREGLALSLELYKETDRVFDITTGAILWGEASKARGLDGLEWRRGGGEFRFAEPPGRLTFGGIAKGMAVGAVAGFLSRSGFYSFHIDAGGGNIAVAGSFLPPRKLWNRAGISEDTVLFVSHSASHQFHQENRPRHIFSPDYSEYPDKEEGGQATVWCLGTLSDWEAMPRTGASSDVWSTVLVIAPHMLLPKNCRHLPGAAAGG